MGKLKVLILGNGRLGSELHKQTGWDLFTRKDMELSDITTKDGMLDLEVHSIHQDYDVIINCIAYTNTLDNTKDLHWKTNYLATIKLVEMCNKNNIKLVHISSDYIYSESPSNASENDIPMHLPTWYVYTKVLADAHVEAVCNDYLTIRTSFKVKPFVHHEAWGDLVGNFDYVDEISKLIIELIQRNASGVFNVGTKTKSIYLLALETNPNIVKTFKKPTDIRPTDVTMNLDKMKKFLSDDKY